MTNRVLIGALGGGAQGIKISRPGVNVLTAADYDLIFHSDWVGNSKIHQRGTLTYGSTASFPSLGFIPVVFTAVLISSSDYRPCISGAAGGGGGGGFTSTVLAIPAVSVTANSITNNTVSPNPLGSPTIYYIVTNMRAN